MSVVPPRRDELAFTKDGLMSQRMITYLEDITQTTNNITNNITEINEYIIGETTNSPTNSLIYEMKKDLQDIYNLIAELNSTLSYLMAENKAFRDSL